MKPETSPKVISVSVEEETKVVAENNCSLDVQLNSCSTKATAFHLQFVCISIVEEVQSD